MRNAEDKDGNDAAGYCRGRMCLIINNPHPDVQITKMSVIDMLNHLLDGMDLVDDTGSIWTKKKFFEAYPDKVEKAIKALYPPFLRLGDRGKEKMYRNVSLSSELKRVIGCTVRRSGRRRKHRSSFC